MDPQRPLAAELSDDDLQALRLGAELLAHRAAMEAHQRVASYFKRLESELRSTLEERADAAIRGGRRSLTVAVPQLWLDAVPDQADYLLVAEYLGLLVANDRLSAASRELCRALRARDSR